MFEEIKILQHQGKQYIPDVTKVELPQNFAIGRPIIAEDIPEDKAKLAQTICPTQAIGNEPFSIDLGKCTYCMECVRICGKDKINFTNDYKTATNVRERLIIKAGDDQPIKIDQSLINPKIKKLFKDSLKLRQVCAGGDSSQEWELGATNNVNFDCSRFGIDFVASPRHADGIVVTGPISENMAEPLQICYDAIPEPKLVILVGTEAISGGIFAGSPALNRSFLDKYEIDLYVPGSLIHPLTFVNGVLELMGQI